VSEQVETQKVFSKPFHIFSLAVTAAIVGFGLWLLIRGEWKGGFLSLYRGSF
jgi:hypothetical protein